MKYCLSPREVWLSRMPGGRSVEEYLVGLGLGLGVGVGVGVGVELAGCRGAGRSRSTWLGVRVRDRGRGRGRVSRMPIGTSVEEYLVRG